MKKLAAHEACARLTALAAQQRAGHVHSVFRSALNLRFGERLVTLLSRGSPLHPYSAVLDEAADFERLGLVQGQPADLQAGRIHIQADEPLVFTLSGAAREDLSIDALPGLAQPADCDEKLAALAETIRAAPGAEEGLAPLLAALVPETHACSDLSQNRWADFLLPRMRRFPALLTECDVRAVAKAGAGLAGCGPGLTPSSDDFLVGVLGALQGAAAAGLPAPGADWCRALATGAASATGDISAGALQSAGQGLFSRDILSLLSTFFSAGTTDDVQNTARQVARFGSSSGTDILAGIWYGLCLIHHSQWLA